MKIKYKSFQERIDISELPTKLLSIITLPDHLEYKGEKVYAVYKLEVYRYE